jgi:hypothetical protein
LGWGAWLREQVYPRGGLQAGDPLCRATACAVCLTARIAWRGGYSSDLWSDSCRCRACSLSPHGLQRGWRGATCLAALLATFNTNPVTTPFFAVLAMTLGHWIMGIEAPLTAEYIGSAFASAGEDLWFNFLAMFGPREAHWDGLIQFWHEIYVPYFIGALAPGFVLSAIAYYVTIPLVGLSEGPGRDGA